MRFSQPGPISIEELPAFADRVVDWCRSNGACEVGTVSIYFPIYGHMGKIEYQDSSGNEIEHIRFPAVNSHKYRQWKSGETRAVLDVELHDATARMVQERLGRVMSTWDIDLSTLQQIVGADRIGGEVGTMERFFRSADIRRNLELMEKIVHLYIDCDQQIPFRTWLRSDTSMTAFPDATLFDQLLEHRTDALEHLAVTLEAIVQFQSEDENRWPLTKGFDSI